MDKESYWNMGDMAKALGFSRRVVRRLAFEGKLSMDHRNNCECFDPNETKNAAALAMTPAQRAENLV